jgi:hypothetical protein
VTWTNKGPAGYCAVGKTTAQVRAAILDREYPSAGAYDEHVGLIETSDCPRFGQEPMRRPAVKEPDRQPVPVGLTYAINTAVVRWVTENISAGRRSGVERLPLGIAPAAASPHHRADFPRAPMPHLLRAPQRHPLGPPAT